jgi:putative SOS response-associated peptidase YedK
MCGRYVSPDDAAIEREFNLVHTEWRFPASFNAAPTQELPVIRLINGVRQATLMRWGLVPFFAKGIPGAYSTINARIETIETSASYRGPWKRGQRCIVPALGFYEWHVNENAKKQPYFIRCANQEIHGYAGLWDSSKRDDGTVLESFTIITLPANPFMAEIHNVKQRMPAILAKEDRDIWLGGTPQEALAVIKPYPDAHMLAMPVSTRVNSPKNNDAQLIDAM